MTQRFILDYELDNNNQTKDALKKTVINIRQTPSLTFNIIGKKYFGKKFQTKKPL